MLHNVKPRFDILSTSECNADISAGKKLRKYWRAAQKKKSERPPTGAESAIHTFTLTSAVQSVSGDNVVNQPLLLAVHPHSARERSWTKTCRTDYEINAFESPLDRSRSVVNRFLKSAIFWCNFQYQSESETTRGFGADTLKLVQLETF